MLIQVVRDNAAKQMMASKSKFAKLYGNPKGAFKMGMNKLDALIGKAVAEGYLSQGPLPQRSLDRNRQAVRDYEGESGDCESCT